MAAQKEIAIKCLETLNIYKPYINKFRSKAGIPCFFENFGGFYVDQEPEIYSKVKEIETEYHVLVYALTHEFTDIGETWSMLCISQNPDCLDDYLSRCNSAKCFYAYSYVWNKTMPDCSEFGDIVVHAFGGGIRRIA